MAVQVKSAGAWHTIALGKLCVKSDGVWKVPQQGWVSSGGVWQKIFTLPLTPINVALSAQVAQVILTFAGPSSGATPASYEIQKYFVGGGDLWTFHEFNRTGTSNILANYPTYVRVRTVDVAGETSSWVTTGLVYPMPLPPQLNQPGLGLSIQVGQTATVTLRFWGPPSGPSATGYEVQKYFVGSGGGDNTWNPHEINYTGVSVISGVTKPTYVRVRTIAAGNQSSSWVQVGPVNDVAAPGGASISSWNPESYYGHMVVRGNWPGDVDVVRGQIIASGFSGPLGGTAIQVLYDGPASPGGGFVSATDFVSNPSNWLGNPTAYPMVTVRAFDAFGNQGGDVSRSYEALLPEALYVDPVGTAHTWGGGVSRGDGWLFVGNLGGTPQKTYFYYGDNIHNALQGKTLVSGTFETWRSAAWGGNDNFVPTRLWVHWDGTNTGGEPNGGVVVDLGLNVQTDGMAISHGNSLQVGIPNELLALIRDGAYRGIALYSTNPNYADSGYFMCLAMANDGGGAPYRVSGRVILHTLG